MDFSKIIYLALSSFLLTLIIFFYIYDAYFSYKIKDRNRNKIFLFLLALASLLRIRSLFKQLKNNIKNIPENFYRKEIWFYSVLLVLFFSILVTIDLAFIKEWRGFIENILVEAHGILVDILIFGILLTAYDKIKSKKEQLKRYIDELNDYRNWQEPEATYRIIGIIKRLNKIGKYDIDLKNCYLPGADLLGLNLSEAKLFGANLTGANLCGIKLYKAKFSKETKLDGAIVDRIDWFDWLVNEQQVVGIEGMKENYIIEVEEKAFLLNKGKFILKRIS
jgi:hypothetical protein